jgi:glyoxylase-like metal-dependent hydrolase (beta-lactamase superfamily II)
MKNYTVIGLFLGVLAVTGANEDTGIFSYKVGQYEVYMIVESERDGNTGILVEPDEVVLSRYIPADGFKHSANAFLIKTPQQNILVDTGTGSGGIVIDKIKSLGVQPEDISAVLITHLHGDHFGSLHRENTAAFPNAKIYLSGLEHEFFTKTNVNQGAVTALAPYGSNVVTFEPGALGAALNEILPGINAIAAYGHTPGHTIFLVQNSGGSLLIIGDLLHIALVQFPVPEISATYDMDVNAAALIRRQVLDFAAKNKIPLGGMHIVYPGIGAVEIDGNGFKFVPTR